MSSSTTDMDSTLDLKLLLKHLVNGNFADTLCRICLKPLNDNCEGIHTKICKEDQAYCIADVLEELCDMRFPETENYKVCIKCFINASNAYKFYLQTKRNDEILSFYINELETTINSFSLPEELSAESLCISLPAFTPIVPNFDFNLDGVINKQISNNDYKVDISIVKTEPEDSMPGLTEGDIVIVNSEDGQQQFYEPLPDGTLIKIEPKKEIIVKPDIDNFGKRKRKKRKPMSYKQCSRCPIKYRFIAKLKEHMKLEHNIDLFACKVCQALIEGEQEFSLHIKMHTNIHQCEICNIVFKKRETIITHMKWHENIRNNTSLNKSYVCKSCGYIAKNEEEFKNHCDTNHYNKYTCYYCGRMYICENSFNLHIEKHEQYLEMKKMKRKQPERRAINNEVKKPNNNERSAKFTCETCGRSFLGERSLMWHNMLHTNERPFVCDVCGRGFVSLNRRNQHALCSHTVATRRCPLCPALFHLRSMVNTHIKKVHLKVHKRRNRTSKHQNVFWDTKPVPIQELSISIQNEILELQTQRDNEQSDNIQYAYIESAGHAE